MTTLSNEDIAGFIESQLYDWPLAKQNYDALRLVERRTVVLGDLEVAVQWNPARMVSTGANTDRESISKRPCFLCKDNRQKEQHACVVVPGWDLLVNPFPILPVHLTIASQSHQPQSSVPYDIVAIAERLPGMAVFFNGAKAGASAPDHLHLQAVIKDELPLLRISEAFHPSTESGLKCSAEYGLDLPFLFYSGVVTDEKSGLSTLAAGLNIGGLSDNGRLDSKELVNAFFWVDSTGALRFVVVPRLRHRPDCFFEEGDRQRIISPGCMDMAGLMVVPRKSDYDSLSDEEVRKIYSDVALPDNIEFVKS